jgi:murein DD-endopeptidase MepM/ murein hydrolase activator NlpD
MSLSALIWAGPEHRTIAVGRRALIAGGAALLVLTLWAAATVWFIVFRDDITAGLLARQSAMQQTYEERIGALRAHLDRLASQALLDRDGLDKRVAEIAARQGLLETRQAFLARLSDTARPAGGSNGFSSLQALAVPAAAPSPVAEAGVSPTEGAKPMPGSFDLRLRGREPDGSRARPDRTSARPDLPLRHRLARIEEALEAIEGQQMQVLDGLWRTAEARSARLREAIREAGLAPDTLEAPLQQGGMGGPLVPTIGAGRGFEGMADRAQTGIERAARLERTVTALPFARPVPDDFDPTSGFGYRLDPFTRGLAMHTGLDFRAEYGAPVRASGAGQVVAAESAGGYGNMVEIDHGNGLSTRYAHLSAIAVAAGQAVEAGSVLGRAGSTGRSTGPHLHYETRVDGEAVDPQRFLRAGARLELDRHRGPSPL